MSTKSIHLDGSEPSTPSKPSPWSTRTRVFLGTLGLLASVYVLWHLVRPEPALPTPETPILHLPAP